MGVTNLTIGAAIATFFVMAIIIAGTGLVGWVTGKAQGRIEEKRLSLFVLSFLTPTERGALKSRMDQARKEQSEKRDTQ